MLEVKTETKYHLVFSHDDADGILAAFAVKFAFDDNLFNEAWPMNVKCHLCNYSKKFNLQFFKNKVNEYLQELSEDRVSPKDVIVYMLDYAIQPNDDMMKFNNYVTKVLGAKLLWVDHHSSAIENLSHFNIPGLQTTENCACVNTWKFLNKIAPDMIMSDEAPLLYKLINEFDLWHVDSQEFSWTEQIVPCALIIQSFPLVLDDNRSETVKFLLNSISNNGILLTNTLKTVGKALFNFRTNEELKNSSKIYKGTFLDKYSCLALNTIDHGSRIFDNCTFESPDAVDLLIIWNFDGSVYEYSIYTKKDDLNVGKLCEEALNGGGHPKAGGGSSSELLIK